ncbi:hypothetical protein Glove_216g159 [Diversispora epigaea]|uniref:Uncharacterized protein n=1 Tax=Diversispora epigaea TaxID=1348612 RepID=A0A397ILY5_9GLOM|nr:hypothetical protein Glove_216g159 [Diversispora epigaea]
MSTSYKCPYCNICYFSNRNSYFQHVNRCINLYDVSTEESNIEVSEVTDMLLDNDNFNRIEERQSVQEIENLPSGSEITDLFKYGDYDADVSVLLEVISNIPERFEEILFENVENLQNEDSNIERLQNKDLNVRSESSRNEDSDVKEFPNESYADLMTLVTKYNLNNKASNAIIKFFNKHSNLSISLLPKNIETGRKYMDKMNLSRLLYYKHRILVHNNKEYFINYQPIENEQSYREQYTENWWKKVKKSILLMREKKSSEFKKLVRETFHNSIKFLLDPLFTNDDDNGDGIELKIDNEIFWFFSRVSTIICDWSEACTFSLTYKSTNSNYPCHFCLVSKENLNNTRLRDDQMILRNKENININAYVATVSDGMYHLDLGLYRYQIEFTKKLLLESERRLLVDKINRRITLILRHPELKIFSGGLQSIALLTANNYRNIMKVMVFVVDDLLNKDLSELHSWIHHIVNTIRKFGAINGYTTETYEALHKTYVKIPYRLSNKKNIEERMMKIIWRKAIIKQNNFKKKFKTPLKFNYSSKLFEFDISETFEFIDKYKNETNLNEKMIKSLNYFIQNLDSYFDLLKISTAQGCHIKIYRSVTLENCVILRTTNMFYKRPLFSNISVTMNDEELFEYQSDNGIYITYNRKIKTIEDIVHIVPRFDNTNEYLDRKQSASSTTPTTPAAITPAATTSFLCAQFSNFVRAHTPHIEFQILAATTPVATTPTATTPITPTLTMPIVLIESEKVTEASSRKKQKTVAGAIKNYYSDDDSPFTHKDVNYLLNKFEEMNSRQIEINNRQIKIEREISDIWKLLASSGIESDYTTENEFINVSVYICYKVSFIEIFAINSNYLKSVTADCTELKFCEYFGGWKNKHWSSYYTKYIQNPLLAKHQSLRGSIANRVRSAFFTIFEEHELLYIDTKSTLQEIKEWKDSKKLKNTDKEMTWCVRIIQKTWLNFKKLIKEKIAFGMAICQYMLNSKTESIKINDEEICKIMKVKKKKLEEGQIIELDNEEGEEEEEEKEEEKEEKEEEEEKEREEREEEYHQEIFYVGDEVIFTGQNFRSRNDSPFTHKDVNYLLNKFEEMNSRQIEINNRQIKIEREISDIWKLLASSGIESDYTTENEFINVSVYICYKVSFIEIFAINSNYLKSVTADCTELKFCEYFGGWKNKHWSSYYTKYIQNPLLAKHQSLRGSIANRVRSAFFTIFEEHELLYIDTKSTLQEIKEWKDSKKLKNTDKEMTWCVRIIQKTWLNFKKLIKEKIAFGMAICQYMLNSKTESIKINDEEICKIMKVKKKKLEEGQIIELDNEEGEEEEEEKEEEKEEKEEEEEKEREEREEEYHQEIFYVGDEVIFTGQNFRSRSNSLA